MWKQAKKSPKNSKTPRKSSSSTPNPEPHHNPFESKN
jgi:hypothetical protein